MHVRASRFTSAANIGNDLSLLHVLTDRDNDARAVRIERLAAVCVLDDDILPVATVPSRSFRNDHVTFGGGEDRGSDGSGEVYAVVTVNTLRAEAAGDRPEVVSYLRRRPRRCRVGGRRVFGYRNGSRNFTIRNDDLGARCERSLDAVVACNFLRI